MRRRDRRLAVLALAPMLCGVSALAGSARAAVLKATTTSDELARHDGRCSLREAIAAVNSPGRRTDCGTATRGSNTIVLRSGRYMLSLRPDGPDGNATGDLDLITGQPVAIVGVGPRSTVIDASRAGDRAITIAAGARLALGRLTVTGGRAPAGTNGAGAAACPAGGDGGGVFNSGKLVLTDVRVVGNRAGGGSGGCDRGQGGQGGSGGGVYNLGSLTLANSTVENNRAGTGGSGGGLGGTGGGIYSHGRLTVTTSTIAGNRAGSGGAGGPGLGGAGGMGGSGGAIFSSYGKLRLVNATVIGNASGAGGPGSGLGSATGPGGNGSAVAVVHGPSLLRNDTVADNGAGGAVFVASARAAGDMTLQNTIVASRVGAGCVASPSSAIANGGHDLSSGGGGCPGRRGNPMLGSLRNNGGLTKTMSVPSGSAAVGQVPRRGGHCPATDQRGVRRPQGKGCDIGAYEYAVPKITIPAPFHGASYERGSSIRARFRCGEGGVTSTIATCTGTVAEGHRIPTGRLGRLRFVVTAVDRSGQRVRKTVHYSVWAYVNPLTMVSGLAPRRIDLGVDYGGSGPLLAIGRGLVTTASDTDSGPPSCWAISCWPGGGIVVYRLLDGPFAGKYVYVAEHLTVTVRVGQTVRPGQQIATLHAGYPWSEWGWAAGPGPEALAMTDGHRCPCSDPGGWSTIDGRNMNSLLVRLGAPSGWLQSVPAQSMPPGWPTWPG